PHVCLRRRDDRKGGASWFALASGRARRRAAAGRDGLARDRGSLVMATRAMDRALSYDVEKVRRDFPILSRIVHGKPLVYLDNAATSQKPRQVIDAIRGYYESYNSNVHRGVHALSEEATQAYERARDKVARFVNAKRSEEIVFVRGTTEAINLVASTFGSMHVHGG